MYFLVKLDWIPKHNGGRDTIPSSTYFCTTKVKFENSLMTCSIRLEIKQDDTNTAYLHFLFEKFSSVVALNDSLTLFEGPHQIGYATILSKVLPNV